MFKRTARTTVSVTARSLKREFLLPGQPIPGTEEVVADDKLGMTFGTKEHFITVVDTPERLVRMFELELALVQDLCVMVPVKPEPTEVPKVEAPKAEAKKTEAEPAPQPA